jgi:predicted methyltransferase
MMRRNAERVAVVAFTFLLIACGGGESPPAAAPSEPTPAASQSESMAPSLAEIAVGAHRSPENIARNAYRHPVETLEFFGIQPDMRVVEIWPGGAWYTEVIAPYLQDNGQYVAANWDPNSEIEFVRNGVKAYTDKLAAHPELYGSAEMTVLMPPEQWDLGEPGSADMVLTFRNIHNWMPRGYAETMFEKIHAVLKPGGVLGVVEHRGNPDVPQDPKAQSGYVNEDHAVAMAEAAGFRLEARSEINANPVDTKDYEKGVWTLPPTLRAGDDEKWAAIGESDRFTLKFVKE